jgi:hypothetical protein
LYCRPASFQPPTASRPSTLHIRLLAARALACGAVGGRRILGTQKKQHNRQPSLKALGRATQPQLQEPTATGSSRRRALGSIPSSTSSLAVPAAETRAGATCSAGGPARRAPPVVPPSPLRCVMSGSPCGTFRCHRCAPK